MKTCKSCNQAKTENYFYIGKSYCKTCHKAKSRAWKESNPDRSREISRASKTKARLENSDHINAQRRRWNEENPEKARESLRMAVKKWSRNNRDQMNAAGAKRKATKLQATPAWMNPEKVAEFYFAADFLGMVTGEWHHVDHVVPLQSEVVCGLHWEGNLQVLTAAENLKKSNSHTF